tara:strand:+ start:300 stop:545 length:246 start_codon:yes stop_codon:yes gene_type:complete
MIRPIDVYISNHLLEKWFKPFQVNEAELRKTIYEATYDIIQAYTQKELLEVHRQAKRELRETYSHSKNINRVIDRRKAWKE